MSNYSEQLYKLMGESTFNHRGVEVSKLIGGFSVLSVKCLNMKEVDRVIDETAGKLEKSIVGKNIAK